LVYGETTHLPICPNSLFIIILSFRHSQQISQNGTLFFQEPSQIMKDINATSLGMFIVHSIASVVCNHF
jgi:hypothetical protein